MQRAIAIAKWMRTSRCSEISFSPQFCAPKSPRSAFLKIRGNTRNSFSDDQAMDVMRAFIGVNRFKVVHVPHDAVIVDDSVGAQYVASLAWGPDDSDLLVCPRAAPAIALWKFP